MSLGTGDLRTGFAREVNVSSFVALDSTPRTTTGPSDETTGFHSGF
jgi:hypothetical protein